MSKFPLMKIKWFVFIGLVSMCTISCQVFVGSQRLEERLGLSGCQSTKVKWNCQAQVASAELLQKIHPSNKLMTSKKRGITTNTHFDLHLLYFSAIWITRCF